MSTEERWVDIEEVAAHLGVNRDSVYRWIETKGFPAHRVGRLFRLKLSEVDDWIKQGGGWVNKKTVQRNDHRLP